MQQQVVEMRHPDVFVGDPTLRAGGPLPVLGNHKAGQIPIHRIHPPDRIRVRNIPEKGHN